MNVGLYADYVTDLRVLLTELDRRPELFQSFDVRFELAAAGGLVVYETKRRKRQTDSLYYGRSSATGANQQVSQAAAFAAIDRFLALGQFIALTGNGMLARPVDELYPHCAVNFSYRKKGQPNSRSMLMVFIGFNGEADALEYVAASHDPSVFVAEHPYRGERAYEWK